MPPPLSLGGFWWFALSTRVRPTPTSYFTSPPSLAGTTDKARRGTSPRHPAARMSARTLLSNSPPSAPYCSSIAARHRHIVRRPFVLKAISIRQVHHYRRFTESL